jgi:hypothetical protein
MMTPPIATATPNNPWLAQHHAQLQRHVEQCWTRRAARTAAQCLDLVHAALGGRFLTTVCAVAAVMLLPSLLF